MLLEFQGKHYNHREPSRDRFHHRYDQHNMGSGIRGAKRERFGPAFFKSEMSDSRPFTSTPPYPRTHHSSLSLSEEALVMEVNNTNTGEGGAPTKRPRLLRDMQLHGPSGAESVPLVGSAVRGHPSPPRHSISSPPRVSTACVYSTSLEFGDGSIVAELKSAYIAECHNTLHCDYLMKLGNTKGH
jgi:hypothetical protein